MSGISEDEVSRLALEAGIQIWDIGADDCRTASQLRKFNRLKRFAVLVAEAERNSIEKVCYKIYDDDMGDAWDCVKAIREIK